MPSLLHTLGRQGACDRQRTGSVLGTFHFRALETCGKYSTEPAIRLPEILATKTHNPKQGCKQKSLRVTKGWHKARSLFPAEEVGPLSVLWSLGPGLDVKKAAEGGA